MYWGYQSKFQTVARECRKFRHPAEAVYGGRRAKEAVSYNNHQKSSPADKGLRHHFMGMSYILQQR